MSTLEFDTQVEQAAESLYSFAYNLTKDIEDAKDLIQETLYRALLNRDKFRMDTNLKAWLYTIMKNSFINNYRRQAKRQTVTDETENQFYINTLAKTTVNDGEVKLGMTEIERALADIDESIRVPFLMYFEGYRYHEIAFHLSIPLGTVKSRIFFARKELQRRLRRF
ncbi:MAG: RNA polymerase sigma factor [Chitinophagaceae bacterium]|nr:RNA polymerase sigma factor [Chitinophagaceae bacterium]